MSINVPQLLVICGTLIVAALVVFLPLPRFQRNASTPVDRPPTSAVFRDDDRYWYGGLFYYNPDNPAMFVPKRFGLGWTLNFGHPRAKLFMIIILLMVLVLVLIPPLLVSLLGTGSLHVSVCYASGCNSFL
jgi:uncharacterized membrane protein